MHMVMAVNMAGPALKQHNELVYLTHYLPVDELFEQGRRRIVMKLIYYAVELILPQKEP